MKFRKIVNGDYIYRMEKNYVARKGKKRRNKGSHSFVDRQKGTDTLIIILAGFQPYYWDVVFNNINVANTKKYDVCVCIPEGKEETNKKIYELAEKYSWSVLRTKDDKLGLAQNLAISLHKNAQWFFKFDEDIIISKDYFSDMEKTIDEAKDFEYRIGFIVPMINISLATMYEYLRSCELFDDFQKKFGTHKLGEDFLYKSREVALYLLESVGNSFQKKYEEIHKKNAGRLLSIPIRFSIGAMYFSRDFWNQIEHFYVGIIGELGGEEEQVCNYCMTNWYSILCNTSVFACHMGYFVQKDVCKDYFLENTKIFMINE